MKIKSLTARTILDSRGQWTVEATLVLANGVCAVASVPQGKSTGAAEAVALPASVAVRNIERVITPKVIGGNGARVIDFKNQEAFDDFLIKLDGTATKSKLGANAILASSIAFARASAMAKGESLWKYIRGEFGLPVSHSNKVTRPRLFMNLINGGLHGGSNLDVQEYVIIPKTRTFVEAVEVGVWVYAELKSVIARTKGKPATNLGDEGGFAPDFKDNLEPIRMLNAIVKKMKLARVVDFGMDAAATDIKRLQSDQLADIYTRLAHEDNFIYLEDPFSENAFEAFAVFTKRFGGARRPAEPLWIAGDDLTTTNVRRMELAHAERSVNAVIIKPNQIGSVTEALDAVRTARGYGWAVVASHRSGETNDDFIADFAYGVGADGLKLGAPARGERVAKYNRLLEIEKEV
jgi:enolase